MIHSMTTKTINARCAGPQPPRCGGMQAPPALLALGCVSLNGIQMNGRCKTKKSHSPSPSFIVFMILQCKPQLSSAVDTQLYPFSQQFWHASHDGSTSTSTVPPVDVAPDRDSWLYHSNGLLCALYQLEGKYSWTILETLTRVQAVACQTLVLAYSQSTVGL